jgi:RNA polymerase sigma-70 factor (ECF subfamily)
MNAAEFKSKVLPISRKLHHFATLLLRDSSEAEDAVQEVCLRLWKIRDSLDSLNNLEAFAMKVTKNWCLDRLKAKKPVYIQNYQAGYDIQSAESDPQRFLESTDRLSLLNHIIDKLPDQQRLVIQLRDLEGLEFDEIVEITEMNMNAVRVNLSRARNRIREEFFKYETNGK